MAVAWQDFPNEELLKELISSFPQEWQGLFAVLNVKESYAIHSGTKWLRDNSSCEQKQSISPHWPDLLRALCQMFPVLANNNVVFQFKFACFTLKMQRNILCFVVYHSESIPVDAIKLFVSMLKKSPQMKHSWCAALVKTLQLKIDNREDIVGMESQSCDFQNKTRTMKITKCCISESNEAKLHYLCSRIKTTSSASSSLLALKFQEVTASEKEETVASEHIKLNVHQSEQNTLVDMEADIQSEVIEISDDSTEASPCQSKKMANYPVMSDKTLNLNVHYPVIVPTKTVSEIPNPSDNLTLHNAQENLGNSVILASPTIPISDIPNPPELDIPNMEVEPSEDDAFINQYSHLKNHLRSSEDLDVELIQDFLECLQVNTFKDLVKIFTFLEMREFPENSIIMLIKQFLLIQNECSFHVTVAFAEHCIGVWLVGLQQAGSRNFLAAVTAFTQKHPKPFVDGVMVKQFNISLLWPQCDLIVKIVKNCEKGTLQYFTEKLVQSNEMNLRVVWNEHMILLLSTVFDRRLDLDVSVFEEFVNWLRSQSLPLSNSLKFAKLVLTIVNKYGTLVKPKLTTFKQILEENNTFLKKSGLTALRKLED